MCELPMDELDTVNGGKVSLVTDKGYVDSKPASAAMALRSGRPVARCAAR